MMNGRTLLYGLLVLLGLVLLFAWIDGGREPQRMIEQEVVLPQPGIDAAEAGR